MAAWVRWVTAIAVLAVSAFFLTDNEGPLHLTLGLTALVVGLWILRSVARASVVVRRMPRTLRGIAVALAAFASLFGLYTLLRGNDDAAFLLPFGAAALLSLVSQTPMRDQSQGGA